MLRRSVDVARRHGNRFVAGVAGLSAVSCPARLGNPAEVGRVRGAHRLLARFGAWTQEWITIRPLVEALTRLRHDVPAAVLSGTLGNRPSAAPVVGDDAARTAEAVAVSRDGLGQERFSQLQARGAAFDDEEAVAYPA